MLKRKENIQMLSKIKFIAILILIIFFICLFVYNNEVSSPVNKNGEDKIFIIKNGEGVKRIGSNLFQEGLIKSKFYFEVYVWRNKKEGDLQAGEYSLSPKLSIEEIVKIISSGEALSKETSIKIIEGWNIKDINKYLTEKGFVKDAEFIEAAKKSSKEINDLKFDFLADMPRDVSLEGFLFPDTYRVFNSSSPDDIIKKMLFNFDGKLTDQMRSDIKKQEKNIYEIITMASIIEKEVRSVKDMKIVSGIFWDRIKNGQALESCATLAYILGINKPQYTIEDTKIESPYNTYQNAGLPPAPISNPGLNAITAAIYPESTDYNYFLSSSDTGETIFSKTYEEHLRNKKKFLK